MADVFLSYARPSAEAAKRIAEELRSSGYSVWLDEELPAHRLYSEVIEEELDSACAVLVVWSEAAVQSQWVRSEANRGREKGKLIQARLDGVRLPMPFDQIQCAQLPTSGDAFDGNDWASITTALRALVRSGETSPSLAPGQGSQRKVEPFVLVFPFREMGSGSDDYLGEGLAEEVLTVLGRLAGIRVGPASAAFGQVQAREAARALSANAYLEGSIRKSADRARTNVRLIDTVSGMALWSETFEHTLSDVFAIQDEIAHATAAAMGVSLLAGAAPKSAGRSRDARANELALTARHLARQELEVERRTAADLFRQAISRDPDFAMAYAGLADVLVQNARWHLPDWQDASEEALHAAQKAVALAPELAEAHLALGAALSLRHDEAAGTAFAQAVALAPEDPNVHYQMARFLVLSNDKSGAIRHYERAFSLAPDDYRYAVYAIQEYQALGDVEGERRSLLRSAGAIERHLELNPSDVRALGHGAGVMALLGRSAESQKMIDRARSLRPGDYGNLVTLACAAMLSNDAEQALDLLEKAAVTGEGDREWLMQDNDLKPLHGNPRFDQIVARMSGS